MYPMGIYKKVKAVGRKAVRAVKKRYMAKPGGRKSTGGVRVAKMAKDIMYLKSVLNPEKKRYPLAQTTPVPFGQVNGNNDGAYIIDATPYISQGVTNFTRNGSGLKLHSTIWQFQVSQQPNAISDIRFIVELWAIDGDPYSNLETFRREKYLPNAFVTPSGSAPRDYNCQMDPDNFMKGKCIARRKYTVKADALTSAKSLVDFKLPILYNKGQGRHIRYDSNTDTLAHGQLCLVMRADRGNMSTPAGPGVSTLTGIQDVGTETGLYVMWNKTDYYYDN